MRQSRPESRSGRPRRSVMQELRERLRRCDSLMSRCCQSFELVCEFPPESPHAQAAAVGEGGGPLLLLAGPAGRREKLRRCDSLMSRCCQSFALVWEFPPQSPHASAAAVVEAGGPLLLLAGPVVRTARKEAKSFTQLLHHRSSWTTRS